MCYHLQSDLQSPADASKSSLDQCQLCLQNSPICLKNIECSNKNAESHLHWDPVVIAPILNLELDLVPALRLFHIM